MTDPYTQIPMEPARALSEVRDSRFDGLHAEATAAVGYSFVYHLEILLLFATLVAIGPLVRVTAGKSQPAAFQSKFGLAELPG